MTIKTHQLSIFFFLAILAQWVVHAFAEDGSPITVLLEEKAFVTKSFEVKSHVDNYLVGLSALQKIRGSWQFRKSERYSGKMVSETWALRAGYSSRDAYNVILTWFSTQDGSRELFSCSGRACGSSSQWANRIFQRRLLYGRDDSQLYSVYKVPGPANSILIVYASARSNDRQYIQTVFIDPSKE